MKRSAKFFAFFLGCGLMIGGLAVANNYNNNLAKASATTDPEDIAEFTNNGQFTYSAGDATTVTLLSSSELETEGVVTSGYEGSALKISGNNTFVTLNFTGSGLKTADVGKISFRVFVDDSSSSLTKCDFRIRKSSLEQTVLNEGVEGHSLLAYRNTWSTYSLTPTLFISGHSFDDFDDGNGNFASFQIYFRTSQSTNIYLDFVNVLEQTGFTNDGQFNFSSAKGTDSCHLLSQAESPAGAPGDTVKCDYYIGAAGLNINSNISSADLVSMTVSFYATADLEPNSVLRTGTKDFAGWINSSVYNFSTLNTWVDVEIPIAAQMFNDDKLEFYLGARVHNSDTSFVLYMSNVRFELKSDAITDVDYADLTLSDIGVASPVSNSNSWLFSKNNAFSHSMALTFTLNFGSAPVSNSFIALRASGNWTGYRFYIGATKLFIQAVNSAGNSSVAVGNQATYSFPASTDVEVGCYVIENGNITTCMFVIDGVIKCIGSVDTSVTDVGTGGLIDFMNADSGSSVTITATDVDSVKDRALNRFGERKLSSKSVSFDDNSETGACLTKYDEAKDFYNTYLSTPQKVEFTTNAKYANLKARFVAWGAANGETVTFNPSTGALSVAKPNTFVMAQNNGKDTNSIILVISISLLSALALFVFIRMSKRRKED